jgi:uncharacterized protein (DUF362 family)
MAKVFISTLSARIEDDIQKALEFIEWETIVPKDARIFFKPNLTYPTPKLGVTTRPAFVDAVLRVFKQRTPNLIVGESDGGYRGWPAEMAFESHQLGEICSKHGARLVNLSRLPKVTVPVELSKGKVMLSLPQLLTSEIDLLVTLPVPKIHQVTTMSGAIKNQWGCIPDNMRLVLHPFFYELICKINSVVRTKIALGDGEYFLNRGGPMEGDPVKMGLLIASDDLAAFDIAVCRIMGLNPEKLRHLRAWEREQGSAVRGHIDFNREPSLFQKEQFYLKRTTRNRVVAWAFDRPWAITLFWNSWFADQFHKVLYAVTGNEVRDEISRRAAHAQAASGDQAGR